MGRSGEGEGGGVRWEGKTRKGEECGGPGEGGPEQRRADGEGKQMLWGRVGDRTGETGWSGRGQLGCRGGVGAHIFVRDIWGAIS